MYQAYAKIVRVFPLQRANFRGDKSTQFGFATETKRHYCLSVEGWPTIEAGMEITAILEKEGDWQTLQGWINHTTGEIVAPARGKWIIYLLILSLMTLITCSSWENMNGIIFLPFFLLFSYLLHRTNCVHKALAAVPKELPTSPEEHQA